MKYWSEKEMNHLIIIAVTGRARYALGGTEIVITQTLFGNEFLVNF